MSAPKPKPNTPGSTHSESPRAFPPPLFLPRLAGRRRPAHLPTRFIHEHRGRGSNEVAEARWGPAHVGRRGGTPPTPSASAALAPPALTSSSELRPSSMAGRRTGAGKGGNKKRRGEFFSMATPRPNKKVSARRAPARVWAPRGRSVEGEKGRGRGGGRGRLAWRERVFFVRSVKGSESCVDLDFHSRDPPPPPPFQQQCSEPNATDASKIYAAGQITRKNTDRSHHTQTTLFHPPINTASSAAAPRVATTCAPTVSASAQAAAAAGDGAT